jgi:bifunctional DNA-binding transcriptional regulator/antitoxin component of YhaV-PrlF toxin-antitoxin module
MTNSVQQPRYEVITQEDPETGDLIIPLPIPVLKHLGWKEGDDVEIDVAEDGQIYLRKTDK